MTGPATARNESPHGISSLEGSPSATPPLPSLKARFRRALKYSLKRAIFYLYKTGTRLGIHVMPVHYYSAEPDILELERTKEIWSRASRMGGLDWNLDEQVLYLKKACLPYRSEYAENTAYKRAVQLECGPGFGYVEAQALHAMIRHVKPKCLIEVGSGVSTYCSLVATAKNFEETGKKCHITCIEPFPSRSLDSLVRSVPKLDFFAKPVQDTPLELFQQLGEGDILFIDSSHVAKAGSDVIHLILEVLPTLKDGVIVHFHDIYIPYDYQRNVLKTFLHSNETPLLRAFLAFNSRFKTLFCLSHLHYECPDDLMTVFPGYVPQSAYRGLWHEDTVLTDHFPSSLWIQVK